MLSSKFGRSLKLPEWRRNNVYQERFRITRHYLSNSQLLEGYLNTRRSSDLDIIISKVRVGSSDSEVVQSLDQDEACRAISLSHNIVHGLLHRFKDDWKSALGIFKWSGSRSDFQHTPDTYEMIVDILGKTKQMETMITLLKEMHQLNLLTLSTVGKVMRRLTGAGLWEDAVGIFDELGNFGLQKNTESMNLLLDTLCKEGKVEEARGIFLELKHYIMPSAHTFNILIHGWCKTGSVDEAHWTIQEMKGCGCRPCVISYSTIIHFYCRQKNFHKVYELFDEMEAQGCPPNVVTFTTVMNYLAKTGEFEEALQIAGKMKSIGCVPDTLFYNALIYVLGRADFVEDAVHVFETEMPNFGLKPNTSTYNTMISMFCRHGQEQRALSSLEIMEESTLCKPDLQTYCPLLKYCFKYGKTDSLLVRLLDDMVNKNHLSLDLSAYSLLIHGLCRANKSDWAFLFFEEMIGQDIVPRKRTCRLLLDEVKLKNMYAAAETIEAFMENM